MDIFRVSDGAFEQLDVSLHDFPSLDALRKAISKVIDIPLENLILFHSSGSQLSDSLYNELGNLAAAESFDRSRLESRDSVTTGGRQFGHGQAGQVQYDLNGNEIHLPEGENKGGLGIALYAFDRESFMAEPHEFVKGIEEDLVLPEALPNHPGFHTPQDILDHFQVYLDHLHDISDRLQAQVRGLDLAGNSLGDHVDRLIRGSSRHRKTGESSEIVGNVNSSQRSAGLGPQRSKESPGTGARTPNLTEFRMMVEQELQRERNLIWKADEDEHTENGASWGMEQDLYLISKIEVEPFFLTKTKNKKDGRRSSMEVGRVVSGTMSKNETSKDGQIKKKFLGDYVSEAKMRTVRESCRQIYDDHHRKCANLLEAFDQMQHSAEEILGSIPSLIQDALTASEEIMQDADTLAVRVRDMLRSDMSSSWDSLAYLDGSMREQIVAMTELKNAFTLNLHIHLHAISGQQSVIAELSPQMVVMEESLLSTRTLAKTGFPHLDRLRNMAYAYGMACIEVVWRKELGNLLHGGAFKIIESLGPHLEAERERRRKFKDDILGLLPYEVEALQSKGQEGEAGPSVDLTVDSGDNDLDECNFSVTTLNNLLAFLDQLMGDDALVTQGNGGANPLAESLAKLQEQVDVMTTTCAQIRQVWESSKSDQDPEPPNEQAVPAKNISALTAAFRSHRPAGTHSAVTEAAHTAEIMKSAERIRSLEADNQALHDRLLKAESRVVPSGSNGEIIEMTRRLEEETSISAEERRKAEQLASQLQEERDAHLAQMQQLEVERSQILQGLSDARNDEEALARKVLDLQSELESAIHMIEETKAERNEALQRQALSAETNLRERLAETDGDRAVLEHQIAELTSELSRMREKSSEDLAAANARHGRELNSIKAEMGMIKAELRDAQRKVSQANDTVIQEKDQAGLARAEKEKQEEFGKETIKVASAFYDCISRLHSAIQSSATISGSTSGLLPITQGREKALKQSASSSLTSADYLQIELQAMKSYDLTAFADSVTRTMGLVKKWQKSCKQYRERSKNQIAFANFTKGDLALFLPTRNASAKSWAAFNIASPHYFLKPTPEIEQSMREREWIVGRIIAVEDGMVEGDEGASAANPYGLADGIKYHELQAEVYIPIPAKARRSASTGSQVGPGTLTRMSTTTGARPLTTPLNQILSPNERTSYFPALLDGSGRPVPPRNRSSQDEMIEPRRPSHPASVIHPDIAGTAKASRRPSSVCSSASSNKFSKGIQLGVGGSGKGGIVVGVTRGGLVDRLPRPVGHLDEVSPHIAKAELPGLRAANLDIPRPGQAPRRDSSTSDAKMSPSSPSFVSSGKFARMTGLRANLDTASTGPSSGTSRKSFSVGEGALDILKRIGENKVERAQRDE